LVLENNASFSLNIEDINFISGVTQKTIFVSNNISLEVKQPVIMDYISLNSLNEDDLFCKVVKAITIDRHRYDLSLLKTKEVQTILDEVYLKNSDDLKKFLKSGPKLSYTLEAGEDKITIEGFLRFFI
jgi:hypothetical protein